ncbi:DUF1080 domain-containing protein [Lentisphaera profundi]|uniref:DUF1080 domain-containing protein n=1 Tax=Lentisphaera profundi TaxID=1658616 RepID=A0ABY7VR64_9BACT|nr:DUF1080 domain-containing protein [Lentisphaera profundi]WDE95708.1 DUF1080 domain-containing protein [Lentisphaera profundi]
MKFFLSIIFALLLTISALPSSEKETVLFDGKSLDGWVPVNKNNAKYWSVIDGVISASNGNKKMPTNTYLATKKLYQNFEFKCKFRLSGDHKTGLINSGIQYRSILKKLQGQEGINKIIGYQADIGKGYWGDIYDEHRRGKLLKATTKELFRNFKEDAWNEYIIRCRDDKHELYINGHKTAEYTENNPKIENYGVIALQLHSGGIARMEYKDIRITEFPPTERMLPLKITAHQTKIYGKTMHVRNDVVVSWNKTNEYLEWTVPQSFESGAYNIELNYQCDINRQGSEMLFIAGLQEKSFLTKSKRKKWGPETEALGAFHLKAGDKIQLRCKKLKADWVLDFMNIKFSPSKLSKVTTLKFHPHHTKIYGTTLKKASNMIVSWNKINEYLEWTYPDNYPKASFSITLNYMNDVNRQGSQMIFTINEKSKDFVTKSQRQQWGPEQAFLGNFDLKPGDKIQLRCKSLKADWVMDFLSLQLSPRLKITI